MDEYAEYLYKRRPHYRNINPGDVSEQKAIRDKLHCKPFKWFMEEVAFDLPKFYPPVEPPPFASGEVSRKWVHLNCFVFYFKRIKDTCAFAYMFIFICQVRNKKANMCLDTRYKGQNERFDLQPCLKDGKGGGEQVS